MTSLDSALPALTATELDLEHPAAIELLERLADAPVATRREEAARRLEEREADLALAAQLLAERFGPRAPSAERLIREDPLAADLAVLAIA